MREHLGGHDPVQIDAYCDWNVRADNLLQTMQGKCPVILTKCSSKVTQLVPTQQRKLQPRMAGSSNQKSRSSQLVGWGWVSSYATRHGGVSYSPERALAASLQGRAPRK